MPSIRQALRELEDFRDRFLDGEFPQRSALGPGSLSSAFLKSKSITSSMIDVSELAAVSVSTGNLTITGTLTLGAGGKITDSDGSYWDSNGIVLISTNTYGDTIRWRNAGVDAGSIWASSGAVAFQQGPASPGTGSSLIMYSNGSGWSLTDTGTGYVATGAANTILSDNSGASIWLNTVVEANAGGVTSHVIDASGYMKTYSRLYPGNSARQSSSFFVGDSAGIYAYNASTWGMTMIDSSGDTHAYRRLYPGNDTGGQQATAYFAVDGSSRIVASGGALSMGTFNPEFPSIQTSGGSGALPSPTKYLVVTKSGTQYGIPIYTQVAPWTA